MVVVVVVLAAADASSSAEADTAAVLRCSQSVPSPGEYWPREDKERKNVFLRQCRLHRRDRKDKERETVE